MRHIKQILMRRKHRKNEKGRFEEIFKTFELWELLNKNGIKKYDTLLNVILYSGLVYRDIYYLSESYYFQKKDFEKNFYYRMLSMSIFEFLEDINHLLGKKFVDELKNNNLDKYIEKIKELSKNYSSIKKRFGPELKEIRNNAAAHKDKDAKKLFDTYNKLPKINLTMMGFIMSYLESQFLDLLTEIYTDIFNRKNYLKP